MQTRFQGGRTNGLRYQLLEYEHFALWGKDKVILSICVSFHRLGDVSALPKACCQATAVGTDQVQEFSKSELLAAQRMDPCLGEVLLTVAAQTCGKYSSRSCGPEKRMGQVVS